MPGIPPLAEVRTYLDLPVEVLPEPELERMWESARAEQGNACRVPTDDAGVALADGAWPDTLVQALLRRLQRLVVTRALPLGYTNTEGEFGPARLLNYDAILDELEGPFRKVVVA